MPTVNPVSKVPLFGNKGLTANDGFASQAEVLIDARTAADKVGATYMDRPEWIAVHPTTKEAYCSLSNNTARGQSAPLGRSEPLGSDAANPRSPNLMGHIIRWRDADGNPASTRFQWDIFLLAGDPKNPEATKKGSGNKGLAFAQPDKLSFDPRGVLWIQTDSSARTSRSRIGKTSATIKCSLPIPRRATSEDF